MAAKPLHRQEISSRGFPIDSNILESIEALWDAGFETIFSCEGDRDGKVRKGYRDPLRGYIAFVGFTEAQKARLQRGAAVIGQKIEVWTRADRQDAIVIRFPGDRAEELFADLLLPE